MSVTSDDLDLSGIEMSSPRITPIVIATCSFCSKQAKTKPSKKTEEVKLPLRWKRDSAGQLVCDACWRERYILRAVTFGVAAPLSGTWKELEAGLRSMWAVTTAASNWMMTQYYVRDKRPTEGGTIPAMPHVYLYPEARVLFPDLPPQSVASLAQSIQRKYRAMRFDVSWRSSASLPTMRYPQPYPIPNKGWSVALNEQNQPILSCRIGEKTWELRLKSGARYWRQIEGLRRMAQRGEMAIYKSNDGTIVVKLVGWLTRFPAKKGEGTLIVRTGKDHLLSALDTKGERIWTQNCDHLLRLIVGHRKRLRRLSEDKKAEQHPVPTFTDHRKTLVRKQQARMKSSIQEIAAHLVNFTVRRHYVKVTYDDSDRWLEEFPYSLLADRVKIGLDERGIAFEKVAASGEVKEDSSEKFAKE